MHMLDTWWRPDAEDAGSAPVAAATAIPPSDRAPVPELTPADSGTTPIVAPDRSSAILASYVGQALAQGYAKNTSAGSTEAWPEVDQGCRLGNYEPTSALCRAAMLAVHGWGDARAIPFDEVVEFCDADYLGETLALCLTARHPSGHTAERISSRGAEGIPESDVVQEWRLHSFLLVRGPDSSYKTWTDLKALCARGIYAPASPVCAAEAIEERGPHSSARVSYSDVASFCDVKLINGGTEICRAAYRFAQPKSDPAR